MGGYRDIMRGPELAAEYDKLQTYQKKSREQKQQLYEALNVQKFTYNKQVVYVAPFGQAAKTLFVEAEICATGTASPGTEALALGGSFFTAAKPTGTNDIILGADLFPRKKLAKLRLRKRKTPATTPSASRITGRKYKRHLVDSVTVFLGKNNASDGFDDVRATIRGLTQYEPFVTVIGNTITFIPEG